MCFFHNNNFQGRVQSRLLVTEKTFVYSNSNETDIGRPIFTSKNIEILFEFIL